jgi:uncharacterized protein
MTRKRGADGLPIRNGWNPRHAWSDRTTIMVPLIRNWIPTVSVMRPMIFDTAASPVRPSRCVIAGAAARIARDTSETTTIAANAAALFAMPMASADKPMTREIVPGPASIGIPKGVSEMSSLAIPSSRWPGVRRSVTVKARHPLRQTNTPAASTSAGRVIEKKLRICDPAKYETRRIAVMKSTARHPCSRRRLRVSPGVSATKRNAAETGLTIGKIATKQARPKRSAVMRADYLPYNGGVSEVRKLWIEGPAGKLEAALRVARNPRGAVVLAHPHPLYGGTLHNPVVFHADRDLNRAGLTTLRFNFRGVPGSDGFHDEGRGEIADVGAAAQWIRALAPEAPLILVGYSFGSRCAIEHAIHDPAVSGVVAIGLPVRVWSFENVATLARPLAVVQGTNDEFGSIAEVESTIARAVPPGRLYPVEGAEHLFPGRAPEAAGRVVEAVEGILRTIKAGTA